MRCYRADSNHSHYLAGFLLGISLRENCYSCRYARPERVSDITIGDFIGLGNTQKFDYPTKNVSSLTTNTDKGYEFYMQVCKSMPELMSVERDYSERLLYKPSMVEPFNRHELNPLFRKLYPELGYVGAIHYVLKDFMKRNRRNEIKSTLLLPYSLCKRVLRKMFRLLK